MPFGAKRVRESGTGGRGLPMVSLLDLGPGSVNPRVFNAGERGGAEPGQTHDWGDLQKRNLLSMIVLSPMVVS